MREIFDNPDLIWRTAMTQYQWLLCPSAEEKPEQKSDQTRRRKPADFVSFVQE